MGFFFLLRFVGPSSPFWVSLLSPFFGLLIGDPGEFIGIHFFFNLQFSLFAANAI